MEHGDRTRLENYMFCKKNEDYAVNTIQYDWILEYIDEKWDKQKWRDYIVNYLLLHYCCRNNDLDCVILTENDFQGHDDETENYLVLMNDGNKVQWIRCNYKTSKTLTALTYVIEDFRFIECLKEMCKKSNFLFENGDDERIDRRSIGRVIQNATYNKVGQSTYFNIVRKHFKDNADVLYQIAQSRPVALRSVVY